MEMTLDGFEEAEVQPEKHISHSQISSYIRCPLVYYWRYIKGMKSPPAAAMCLGSSIHKAFEHNYGQKIYSHQDVPKSVVLDVFHDSWKEGSREAIFDSEKEETPSGLLDEGSQMVAKYHDEVAPNVQPKAVETRVNMHLPGVSREVLCYIDLIDEHDVICDHKTSKKAPDALTLAKDNQLTLYRMGFRQKFGKNPTGLRYDYIVRKSSKKTGKWVEIHPMPVIKTETHERLLIETFKTVTHAIKMCMFHTPDQFSFICTPTGCGYWDRCQGCVQRGGNPSFLDEIRAMQEAALQKVREGAI